MDQGGGLVVAEPVRGQACADGGEQDRVEGEVGSLEAPCGVERAGAPVEAPGQQRGGLSGRDPDEHGQCLVGRLVVGSGGEFGEDGRGLGGGRAELAEQG